jgi:hypothetical protein
MRLRTLAAVAAATLLVPAVADAAIVPQEGIAGVKIGMTQSEVREVLGAPKTNKRIVNEIAGDLRQWTYGKTTVTFDSTEKDAEVMTIVTRSAAERTAQGVGVGSTRATVRKKVPKVRCKAESGYDHCYVGAFTPGAIITDFTMSRGKVSRVVVGLVID